MQDERLKRSADHRSPAADPRQETRATEDRAYTENRALSDAELRQTLRNEWLTVKLPDPPPGSLPDQHLVWLSTTNQSDPIGGRLRLGYSPVKVDEIPGWKGMPTLASGDHIGCIGVNEMVLFKIPRVRYEQIMRIIHHDMPLESERSIKAKALGDKNVKSEAQVLGLDDEYDGFVEERVKRPRFEG